MDEDMIDTAEHHSRTIIHIDIDCFYAQVEEIRNPTLRAKPLGIQQKNIVVTCNYVARRYGVGKLMLLSEAQKLCPNLVLVKGEDLTNYRQMSAQIFDLLHTFTPNVEKLGMDENFLDVTDMVNQKLLGSSTTLSSQSSLSSVSFPMLELLNVDGYIFPENESLGSCGCGCDKRLIIGTHIAKQIRDRLFSQLGITCCAGIAHNKLLAKIIGSKNKPNKQTVLVPSFTTTVMSDLNSLRCITGIGEKTESLLTEIGIKSVLDLQQIDLHTLQNKFGYEMANKLKDISFGRDNAPVKPSGKPKSISLEDSCKSISLRADVEEKFRLLLVRLINQVTEDGRIPIVIKIILRKFDARKKTSHRETKQANILPTMFKQLGTGKIILVEGGQDKLLKIVMRLFERSVDLSRPFNITLLGLAFSRFQEKKKGSRSIANFLIKKSDVEVQSITSLSSEGFSPNNDTFRRYFSSSPMQLDFESVSDASHASCSSDVSESEIEPSPKKTRIGLLFAKRRFAENDLYDAASPSKLRVSDLRLNSREFERDSSLSPSATPLTSSTPNNSPPLFVAKCSKASSSTEINLMATTSITTGAVVSDCPPTVDQDVFKELPMDVQQELLTQWRSTASGGTTGIGTIASRTNANTATNSKNTLHRYFVANKLQR